MRTRNVSLSDHFDDFIAKRIEAGQFSNASEVVREGLRLLEQREREDEAKLEWLRAAAKEGFDELDRGEGITLRSEQDIAELFKEIHAEVISATTAKPKKKRG